MQMTDIFDAMESFLRSLPPDVESHVALHDAIQASETAALSLLNQRLELLTDQDRKLASPYTAIGYFTNMAGDQQLAAWVLALELGKLHQRNSLRSRFERYSNTQRLFVDLPKLLEASRERELIPLSSVKNLRTDGVVSCGTRFARIDPYLPPALVANFSATFPAAPLFVRLDPDFVKPSKPKTYLAEEVIVPADPYWWRTLGIHRGQEKGSRYALPKVKNPADDLESFLEFHVRSLRTIEVHAQRPKADYLSMMVEELVDSRQETGLLIGRCIHWDTRSPSGVSPSAADVQHLDLAINVYEGRAAEIRLAQCLSKGRVVDASFRTHLLRIESIPAQALFWIATQFFRSQILLSEWHQDQFAAE